MSQESASSAPAKFHSTTITETDTVKHSADRRTTHIRANEIANTGTGVSQTTT